MADGSDSLGQRIKSGLRFWLVVTALCAVAGVGAFYFGRDSVGKRLHEMEVRQRAPEITPQVGSPGAASQSEDDEPPLQPIVTMTEREPTAREERRVAREVARPEDGASLHATEGETDEPTDDEPADTGDEDHAGPSVSPGFVVTSGAFADESNARRQVERLAEHGYQAYTSTVQRDGITYQRVNVGVYGSREEAEEVRDRLRSQGFDATIWAERE